MFKPLIIYSYLFVVMLESLSCISNAKENPPVAANQLITENYGMPSREDIVRLHIHSCLIRSERHELCNMPSCQEVTYTKKPNMIDETYRSYDDSGNCMIENRMSFDEKDTFFILKTVNEYNEKGKLFHSTENTIYINRDWRDNAMKIIDSSFTFKEDFFSKLYQLTTTTYKKPDETYTYVDSTVFDEKGLYVSIYRKRKKDWEQTYEWKYDSLSNLIYAKHVEEYPEGEIKTTIYTTSYFPDGTQEVVSDEYSSRDNFKGPYFTTKTTLNKNNKAIRTLRVPGPNSSTSYPLDSTFYDSYGNVTLRKNYDENLKLSDSIVYEYDFVHGHASKVKTFTTDNYNEKFYVYKSDSLGSTVECWNYYAGHAVKSVSTAKRLPGSAGTKLVERKKLDANGNVIEMSYYANGHLSEKSYYTYKY